MSNPWLSKSDEISLESKEKEIVPQQFEDNFTVKDKDTVSSKFQPLPDSQEYLQNLEKKLRKLKSNQKILDQLKSKREDCISNLLRDNSTRITNDEFLELETPIQSSVQEICRHFCPEQPLSVGEVVHIIQHDHLEKIEGDDDEEEK
ncbi:hypothetical protein ACFFRR_006827 [Megaselia abdita]